jgi:hypothetical protein
MATYTYAVASPISMPTKPTYTVPYQTSVSRAYGISPPESARSVTSSSQSGAPSYGSSHLGYSTTSSYAGSEYESRQSASGVDLQDYVSGRFEKMAIDPVKLDRGLVKQAQA